MMELADCIKDCFDDSLHAFINSDEYTAQKEQENKLFEVFRSGLSDAQKQQFSLFIDAATTSNSMLLSEAYLHGVVEGIALRKKVVTE